MDFDLSPEQQEIHKLANEFADREIAPGARERDRAERFPWDVLKKMAPIGFLGGPIPEEYGGMGVDFISHAIITEAIGRADSSVRTTLSVQISLVEITILKFGSEEQKRSWLPRLCTGEVIGCFGLTEPAVGSDATRLQATAKRDGSDWILNGRKMWISNGSVSKLALVFANADPSLGHKGITAFLIDREKSPYGSQELHGKLGLRSSDSSEVILDNVRVPDAMRLGAVGDGFKIAMTALDSGRYSVAAGAVGQAQAAIDASVAYATQRQAFGKPIAAHQLVQELIADMVVETEAARLLVYRAGHLKNKGVASTRETSIAKLYAGEIAQRACDNAIQIHGGYGFSDEFPVERLWRDARVNRLYEGTTQIQKLIIGRFATGIDAIG
ncbi:MAG TPA: acyl-CoA dehydrogenase family protein [Candidatus Limnocylindria bacterium]|jgi:alkylation response protein AidB-like acyl-CoA dehydrogenase|nr:acyl-CoA dehydrogenase family protein [Candidatus Limnocylindria bacterium]